jgi:hypothetical protein
MVHASLRKIGPIEGVCFAIEWMERHLDET